MRSEDEETDDFDDQELPEESDSDDSESVDMEPCPFCGEPVYEQADICSHCGNFITRHEAPARRSSWFIAGVMVCLIIVLFVWIF